MGAWLNVFSCPTMDSAKHLYCDLCTIIYLSIVSVGLSVGPDTHATHSGLVHIVIISTAGGYVGRSGPGSRCCCLCYSEIFLAALLDTQHRFDVHLLV